MFWIFKPAPYLQRIKDPATVKKNYRYWQFRTLIGMYVGYALFYFTRNNLITAKSGLMADFGYSMTDLGWVFTLAALMYGVGKFVLGLISDRSNPRYFMGVALIFTGILNIVFGFTASIIMLGMVWMFNSLFQAGGWPPCGRLLMHWYGHRERARWWAVWNTSHNLGAFLIPLIASGLMTYFGWRYALYVPGVIAIIGGFFLINRLRDTPQSLGLPPIEEYRGEVTPQEAAKEERELSAKEILFKYVLTNRFIWTLAFAYFFIYVMRLAISQWSNDFLIQKHGYGAWTANTFITIFEVGGFVGSLAAGFLSDRLFKGRRGPVNTLYAVGIVGSVAAFWFGTSFHWIAGSVAMFSVGFFIFGPQMLIGVAASELSHKKAAGTATGFCSIFGYAGAAFAGAPIAAIVEGYGWHSFFITIIACGVATTLLLLPLWRVERKEDTATKEAEAA